MATPIGLRTPSDWDMNISKYSETDILPLMQSPIPVILILAFYLSFVLKIGPTFMKGRDAFKLNNTLIAYNAIQVLFSVYLVQEYLGNILRNGLIPSQCQMKDDELRKGILRGIWLYFAAKITELLDTVFFVLRKKNNQVTFLHVYHHSIMMIGTWAYLKYAPSDNVVFIGFFNSLVHVFMYTYYGLAAFGPHIAKYLTWKKYMTSLQLLQFVSIFVFYLFSLKYSACPPSKGVAIFFILNILFFLALFSNFYVKAYKSNLKVKSYANDNGIIGANGGVGAKGVVGANGVSGETLKSR